MPATAEPPAAPETAAAKPAEPKAPAGKTNFGDKFRTALSAEKAKEEVTPPIEAPEASKPPNKEKKPVASKPSALDLALAGDEKKSDEVKPVTEEPDPLKDFDDKKQNWPKAREVMRHLSDEKKTLLGEVQRLKGELGKVDPNLASTVSTITKERDTYKEENSKLRDAITAINVEYDPSFQAKYVAGRDKLVDRAVTRVKEYGGDVSKFTDALTLTGKHRTAALKEALVDVDPIDQPRIISVLDDIQKLDDERAEQRKDPQQAFERLNATRREEQERLSAETDRARKSEFEKTVQNLRAKSLLIRTVDPTSEGGSAWNDDLKSAITGAEALFGPETPFSEIVETSVMGKRMPFAEKIIQEQSKELAEARKRLREYEEASPEFNGRRKPSDTTTPLTPAQKYRKALEEEQGGGDDGV